MHSRTVHGSWIAGGLALCLQAHAADLVASHACPSQNRTQESRREALCFAIPFGGRTRTLSVYAPPRISGPRPLILVLHGGGGTGVGMEWLTKRGFNRIADRDGAIVLYPDGIEKSWNDGRGDSHVAASQLNVDDLAYLRALPQALAAHYAIDPARIYATGISNGGLMSYRLACDAADVFAAVAPVAADLSVALGKDCHPAREVSIAIVNGTEDPIMPWQGGAIKILWSSRGQVLSGPASAARWLELDHCEAFSEPDGVIDAAPDDGTSLVRHVAHCARASEVDLYEIRGGGHTWPGGEAYLGRLLVGRVSRELDANEAIWRFLASHRLR